VKSSHSKNLKFNTQNFKKPLTGKPKCAADFAVQQIGPLVRGIISD